LTVAGGGLATGLGGPAGLWAGYGLTSVAGAVGFGTLWWQRGLLERRAKEMAVRRRTDLAAASASDKRHRDDVERLRTELEREQQYSTLVQNQLTRAREQLERERAARREAERELDALTGTGGWQASGASIMLTVEEPRATTAQIEAETEDAATAESQAGQPAGRSERQGRLSAARGRGWTLVEGEDRDESRAEAELLYRPFIDQLSAPAVPVSDAALAMAPVIGAADLDGVLDLTAYDETVEFSVREIKGLA
jgi:hypothetical protein